MAEVTEAAPRCLRSLNAQAKTAARARLGAPNETQIHNHCHSLASFTSDPASEADSTSADDPALRLAVPGTSSTIASACRVRIPWLRFRSLEAREVAP